MGCCSAPKNVVIEMTVLRVEGESCERCGDTIESVRTAVRELQSVQEHLNMNVTLVERAASAENLEDSNTVVINGRPIEEWMGAERVSTDCPSCGDLVGKSVCCGAVSIGGTVQESFSTEQVRDAVFMALGVVPAGGCCS